MEKFTIRPLDFVTRPSGKSIVAMVLGHSYEIYYPTKSMEKFEVNYDGYNIGYAESMKLAVELCSDHNIKTLKKIGVNIH